MLERVVHRVAMLLAAFGIVGVLSALFGWAASQWFAVGLVALAASAVLFRFGGPADWWKGMGRKDF